MNQQENLSSDNQGVNMEFNPELANSRIRHLSRHQKKVLEVLHAKPNLCNKEIAKFCFIQERSISGSLSDLESMGIVIKSEDKADKRKSLWSICDQKILDAMTLNKREWPQND